MIEEIVNRENSGEILWEGDYSRLFSAIIPYYFHVTHNTSWVITPEFNYRENIHPDYTVFLVNNNYHLLPYLIAEIKSRTGKSWMKLLEQMWYQCDLAKNDQGKIWAIGVKGLEISCFRFDISKYPSQVLDCYTNFEPLNLSHLTYAQLDALGVKYNICLDGSTGRIGVIKWRLDNRLHWPYINHMLEVMRVQNP